MLRNALAYLGVLLVGVVVAGAAFWGLAKFIDPSTAVGGGRQLLVWPLVIAAGVSFPLLQVSFNSRGRFWVFLIGMVLFGLALRVILSERFALQQSLDGYIPVVILIGLFIAGFWYCDRLVFVRDAVGEVRAPKRFMRRDAAFLAVLLVSIGVVAQSFAYDYYRTQPEAAIDLGGPEEPVAFWSAVVNGNRLLTVPPAGTPCNARARISHPFTRLTGLVDGQAIRLDWRRPTGAIKWRVGLAVRWGDGEWSCGWHSNGSSIVVVPEQITAADILIDLSDEARLAIQDDYVTLSVCKSETSCRRLDIGGG